MASDGPVAVVTLTVAPGDGPGDIVQVRGWAIPAAGAEAFAAAMAERYGPAILESVAPLDQFNAGPGAVFYDPQDGP